MTARKNKGLPLFDNMIKQRFAILGQHDKTWLCDSQLAPHVGSNDHITLIPRLGSISKHQFARRGYGYLGATCLKQFGFCGCKGKIMAHDFIPKGFQSHMNAETNPSISPLGSTKRSSASPLGDTSVPCVWEASLGQLRGTGWQLSFGVLDLS